MKRLVNRIARISLPRRVAWGVGGRSACLLLLTAAAVAAAEPRAQPGFQREANRGFLGGGAIIIGPPGVGAAEALQWERMVRELTAVPAAIPQAQSTVNGIEIQGDQVGNNVVIADGAAAQIIITNGQAIMVPIDGIVPMVIRRGGPDANQARPVLSEIWSTWVFRTTSAADARQMAEEELLRYHQRLDAVCRLTSDQQRKLLIAGQIDIDRFMVDCEAAVAELLSGPEAGKTQNLGRLAMELRKQYQQGLHGPGSLFAKTLQAVLDDEQREALDRLASSGLR